MGAEDRRDDSSSPLRAPGEPVGEAEELDELDPDGLAAA
eukprot:SAG11_NODE_12330_length_708_cov_1.981938_2_plen_38_part_01